MLLQTLLMLTFSFAVITNVDVGDDGVLLLHANNGSIGFTHEASNGVVVHSCSY
jgi:hypothetical protein